MTIPARFDFTTNVKLQGEAMIAGTQDLMGGPHRIIWTAVAGIASAALYLTHQHLMLRSFAKHASTRPLNTGRQIIELADTVTRLINDLKPRLPHA